MLTYMHLAQGTKGQQWYEYIQHDRTDHSAHFCGRYRAGYEAVKYAACQRYAELKEDIEHRAIYKQFTLW
jgi:hypothetical protein